MKFPPFEYRLASSPAEACELMSGEGARPLAGGQSLLPLMALRLARPAMLVDVTRLGELQGVEIEGGGGPGAVLNVGACTTHAELLESEVARSVVPVLAAVAAHVGHGAIRHLGTVGGSVAHADPAAEWPATCVALRAEAEITSPSGVRCQVVEELLAGPYQTRLAEDELVTRIRFPVVPGRRAGVAEIARRPGDFALAGALCVVDEWADSGGASLTLFGVAGAPLRVEVPRALLEAEVAEGGDGQSLREALDPHLANVLEDMHADAAFRRRLAAVAAARAASAALGDGRTAA